MSELLDRLEALVQDAESKALHEQTARELRQAAERLRGAVRENEAARGGLAEAHERSEDIRDRAEIEEQRLVSLIERVARLGDLLPGRAEAESMIADSRVEIEQKRQESVRVMTDAEQRASAAVRVLQEATTAYRQARESARLAGVPTGSDEAEMTSAVAALPEGELAELERDVADAEPWFENFPREGQYARLRLWIGRLRKLQTAALDPDHDRRARRLFTRLVGISKEHQPGYIDAFRPDFSADWDLFIADARRDLEAVETRMEGQRARERSAAERERQAAERRQKVAEAKDRVRAFLTLFHPAEGDGHSELRDLLRSAPVEAWSDEQMLQMLQPYAEFLEGPEFRTLRRNLQKLADRAEIPDREEPAPEVLRMTEGKSAVMVGGEPREAARRSLEAVFGFRTFEWLPAGESEAARLESRIGGGTVELVIVLRSFVAHTVANRLFAVCKAHGVPFALVEQGYGAARIARALAGRILAGDRDRIPLSDGAT
jgi:hypothetical protein